MLPQDFDQQPVQPSKRERVKTLLRALLAKTVANGCTEEEAAKAAEKASELMAQYDLSYEDAQQVKDEVLGKSSKPYGRTSRLHEVTDTWWGITRFTTTKCYFTGPQITFFGQRQDVEVAHYLMDMFIGCANAEWKAYGKGRYADTSIRGRKAFMRGLVHRLNARLLELRKARDAQSGASTSNALVVLKGQLVNERYKQLAKELRIRRSGGTRIGVNTESGNYQAGQAAGSRVNITTGVGSTTQRRLK